MSKVTPLLVTFLVASIILVHFGCHFVKGDDSSGESSDEGSSSSLDDKSYLKDEYAPFKKSKKKGEDESDDNEVAFDPTNYQLTNLTVQFDQLGWKVLCDEDEWKEQFLKVRAKFTQCVELSKIILPGEKDIDEDKQKRTLGMFFSDGISNPFCRLSRNWLNCFHYLEKVTCLDPDTVRLEAQKAESSVRSYVEKYLPKYKKKDTWIAMHRAYKIHCLVSKAAMASNPFGPFGGGMFF